MSCHSSPGNRAVLSLARHGAGNSAGSRHPLEERQAQEAFHLLSGEARSLDITAPTSQEVHRWFADAEYLALTEMPKGRSRDIALRNLAEAERDYRHNPASLTGSAFHAWKHCMSLTSYRARRRHNKEALVVAVDMDGCLYDFNTTFREWLVARGWDRRALPEPAVYSLHDAWEIDPGTMQAEMRKAVEAGVMFRTGDTFPEAREAVRDIGLAGHTILVNSARNLPGAEAQSRRATVQWLRDNDLHPDAVHMADPTDPADKLRPHFDILIDDHPENVRAAMAAGREAILLDRPWNRIYTDLPRADYRHIAEMIAGRD